MWIRARYEPVAAFCLRPSNTTSSGGRSLLCPTPYAIKMAILDRAIRLNGENVGRDIFPAIRDLHVWFGAAEVAVLNRTFQRILRPQKNVLNESTGRYAVWNRTIVQREYCYFSGTWDILLDGIPDDLAPQLEATLSAVNYFGRRGGFFQLTDLIRGHENPDTAGLVNLSEATSPDDSESRHLAAHG